MASQGITSLGLSILIATAIVVILFGTYAAITFTNGGSTSITCGESSATFAVLQNSTTTYVSYPIPAEPCQHQITLTDLSLNASGENSQIQLGGMIHVVSKSQLVGLIMYFNGTYELYNPMSSIRASSYSFQYNTVLDNTTIPIIPGMNYTVEFVAIFKDGTATTASATLRAV
jgi:hypothetical protein